MEWVLLILFFGLLFDYTNGFHDAANVVSTVIATRVMAPLSAIVMAAVLNFMGATQISGVAETIASNLVAPTFVTQSIVLAALMGAIVWNFITWYFAIPSSSSYALVGGLLGAALSAHSTPQILWYGVLTKVIIPMIASPILGFLLAWLGMRSLLYQIKLHPARALNSTIFRHLQIGSACFVALSHGLNDAQKSMGIITLGLYTSNFIPSLQIPIWVIFACALVMGIGTATGGLRIVKTMGFSITKLEPAQGFIAESASSLIILTASLLGMPISSTHVITGGITGVGAAKGASAVAWKVPKRLALAWGLTLPGAGLTAGGTLILIEWFISKGLLYPT
jgi:PiT family inorganic phosphate transporter